MLAVAAVSFAIQGSLLSDLERNLVSADLDLRGEAFCHRIQSFETGYQLSPYWGTFGRVEGDRHLLLARFLRRSDEDYESDLLLLYPRGRQVGALLLHRADFIGSWGLNCIRRFGNVIVGSFTEHDGTSPLPVGVILRLEGSRWRLVGQTIDKKHEISSARFVGSNGSLLVGYRSDDFKALTVPHAGPHLVEEATWRRRGDRFIVGPRRKRPTALAALDEFCDALRRGDRKRLVRLCPDAAVRSQAIRFLRESEPDVGPWHPTCVGSDEKDESCVIGVYGGSGDPPSRFLEFRRLKGAWRIARLGSESELAPRKPR